MLSKGVGRKKFEQQNICRMKAGSEGVQKSSSLEEWEEGGILSRVPQRNEPAGGVCVCV